MEEEQDEEGGASEIAMRELGTRTEKGRHTYRGVYRHLLTHNIMSPNGFGKREMWVPPMKQN